MSGLVDTLQFLGKYELWAPAYTSAWALDTELMAVSVEAYASEKSGSQALAVSFDDTLY